MKKKIFQKAHFLLSAYKEKDFPHLKDGRGEDFFEIAIVGRSNVGKSSLLNHLFGQKGLAKTSSTPGKTQSINFFSVDDAFLIVDLPGYGFAKIPKKLKNSWATLMDTYFSKRKKSNKLLLLLLDCRRDPSKEDLQLIEWTLYNEIPLLFVLTKKDKLSSRQFQKNGEKIKKEIERSFSIPDALFIPYSIKEKEGREKLLFHLFSLLSKAKEKK